MMFKSPSISFFVVGIVFANVSCGIEEGLLDMPPQTEAILKEDLVLNALINATNFTFLLPFRAGGANVQSPKNGSIATGMRDFDGTRKKRTASSKEAKGFQSTLTHLARHLFSSVPPFDLSSIADVGERCRKDSLRYKRDLDKLKLWALKMYDANAKIPSGFLNGNINQLGDFDLCLSVDVEKFDFRGQYCLASMQVETPKNSYLAAMHDLIHSHSAFRSKLEDPGHRVPRFSSINWALCVPSTCSANDVEMGLRETVNSIFNGTDLKVRLEVNPEMCQTSKYESVPLATWLSGAFFLGIVSIALVSTVCDFCVINKNETLVAFSLKKNLRGLLSMERPSNDIEAVHGIRFVNAFMLLMAHKSMALFFVPYINRTKMSTILGKPWTVFGRAASLYTDPFIMISATLTTYSLLRKLQRTNKINIFEEYISRLFRIIPTLGALIIFCTLIFPRLNNGPQWNLVVTHHAENCKKYWWRNMLFIHNYYGFKDMCLTHTHHVGIDTQLFLLCPLAVPLLWKWPRKAIPVLVLVGTVSTAMRYYVTVTRKLSNYVHFGASIEQLFNTADYMYILPTHRATVYVMGMLLGYLLHEFKNYRLSKPELHFGNMVAAFSFCVSYFGPSFMGSLDYVYDPTHAAWYAAFAPILWCASFGWIIFTTHIGQKGILGLLFSNKLFLISTRLSYAVYLTQFPIFFYNVGVTRAPEHYTFLHKNVDVAEILWIVIFSVILTVLFELPFQNIRNVLLKKKKTEITKHTYDGKTK